MNLPTFTLPRSGSGEARAASLGSSPVTRCLAAGCTFPATRPCSGPGGWARSWPGAGRTLVWIVLSLGLTVGNARAEAGADAASDRRARFQAWLEAPPALERLVFREKMPPVANEPISMQTGIRSSTNFATFELRWQTGALWVRSLETPGVGPDRMPPVAFTLLHDNFCFLDQGTNAFLYHMEHERVRRGQVPPAYDAAWYRISRFAEVLNLGLSHLFPGSVRWDGERFQAQGLADKKPLYVLGEITGYTNGIPCELRVAYSNQLSVAHYRLAYEYQERISPTFPSAIRLYLQTRGREIEYRSYEVLEVKLAKAPMPESWFAPSALMDGTTMELRYFTNDSIYVPLPSGRMLETPSGPAPRLALSREDYFRNRYYYLAGGCLTAFFGLLAFRRPNCETRKQGDV